MDRKAFRRLLLFGVLLASIVIALLAGEGAVRVFAAKVCAPRRFEPNGVPFTRIPNGPIVYQPNVTFASVYDVSCGARDYLGDDGRIVYHINALGMRGPLPSLQKPIGGFRIVCLGDSITFGEGVRYKDTYPARLQAALQKKMSGRRVEVMNAGVQAFGTNDEAAFYLYRCAQFKPDVVTLGFFLNDAMPRRETIRQNEAMTSRAALSGFAKVCRLWEMLERSRRSKQLQAEYFASIRRSFESSEWNDCKRILAGMQQVGEEDGFRFVVVLFPVLCDLDSDYPFRDIHAKIAAACREAGCEFIDLLDVFEGHDAESLWVHPTDQHPNEVAHHLAAQAIAAQLLPRQSF